ncbi:SDR family NAD(P)-dependent oxidoreductase [Mycobacterium paraterrae]|uniref:SDR family oxidoreductase n=1 Tax=Mycobacterium paraterrae TaxID=577492 RepID=A0ABY3VRF1_9MYCO|nr:SDR family oxidoreductase [Mycobacterium paraterrae]UMB71004.1 SDR family oxidoreductase [Mycobacterium paraterrae]
MKRDFADKVVLITGASRGLGKGIALEFARRGAAVVLVARSAGPLEQLAQQIHLLGGDALAVPTDVTSTEQVEALVNRTMDRFGRIDVLVNNAGIARVGPVESLSFAEDARQTMQASLFGAISLTQQVLPILRRQGSGTVVNMSSVMGRKAIARFGSYGLVMHAMSGFSDALRQELAGTKINVSVIYPALTATTLLEDVDEAEMPPAFRYLTPLTVDEVSRAVVTAVRRGKRRVVIPRIVTLLLVTEAISSRVADLFLTGLARYRWFGWPVGLSRGRTYHQSISPSPASEGRRHANTA